MYFSKISTCIESEAIGGILMNKLHYIDDTNEILINKDDKINTVRTNIIENEDIELNMKEFYNFYRTKGIDLRNLKLCSELSNFRFIGWNLETEVSFEIFRSVNLTLRKLFRYKIKDNFAFFMKKIRLDHKTNIFFVTKKLFF